MAKKIDGYIKLQVPAGTANPSPPIGPALGQRGVNIMEFCKAFNAATDGLEKGMPIPTTITVYADRSFSFTTKSPPASFLIKKASTWWRAKTMAKQTKKQQTVAKLDSEKLYSVDEAIATLREHKAKFDETVEVAMNLGVDPRHADQMVRGMVSLPSGTGKDVKVAVFAKGDNADKALAAGADKVGAEDLMEDMQNGNLDYDRVIATPDMMGVVGRLGKLLGPKGLMPNPKLGTVTPNVEQAVKDAKGGQVEFRVEKQGIIHSGIGKLSFKDDDLKANFKAMTDAIVKAKPSGSKGKYVQKITLTSSMGPGLKVDLAEVEGA